LVGGTHGQAAEQKPARMQQETTKINSLSEQTPVQNKSIINQETISRVLYSAK
jgi:hypothetical protein